MMNTKSAFLSLRTGFFLTVLVAVIYILSHYALGQEVDLWALLIMLSGFYIAAFVVFKYTFQKYIYNQIKIIYDTIFQVKKKALPEKLKSDGDIISEVHAQVKEWEKMKTDEITKLKQLENYRKEFLGNVSHELKTPIFNIQGYILTLLDGGLEDENINMKYLSRAEKSIERMINIVKDLESISKLETGQMDLNYMKFNLVSLVKDIFESFEIKAVEKNIELKLDKDYQSPVVVYADKLRISQVLTNLISNSINYGNEKGGKTVISLHDLDDKVLVQVADNGIGIEKKHLPRLFERFYRVDKSRSRDSGGTGLGLAIVKHIVDAHGQSLNVTSEYGKGTNFSFTLPKE